MNHKDFIELYTKVDSLTLEMDWQRSLYRRMYTYDPFIKDVYSKGEIVNAFRVFGINFEELPGSKWYEFFKDDFDVKFINGLKQLKYGSN